ncbi:uncharacterized protein KGF55_000776 [Candida pseudojiufengensis]|uniref:uncharacterized protein n=1 Tax=Candida pseudojiufengensis TaxID=497109 RepID=UPI002223FC75|nr:uncharacterized protein KGF55_000776 [Candida pseudojiufengensis]KAI5966467.1 hypothetical protein KGF55_000776 [Candida pseudojiufengensis]
MASLKESDTSTNENEQNTMTDPQFINHNNNTVSNRNRSNRNLNNNNNDSSMEDEIDNELTAEEYGAPEPERNPGSDSISFFSPEFAPQRKHIAWKFLINMLALCTLIMAAFSIYWGSYYDRQNYLKNLNFLVVIGDERINGVEPIFGNTMNQILSTPFAKQIGDWHIYDYQNFANEASKRGNTVEEEILRQVHHQKYWASIYLKPEATLNYQNALENGDSNYNITANTIVVHYETGRDFLNMNSYIIPQIQKIEKQWLKLQPNTIEKIINNQILIDSTSKIQIISTPLSFEYIDRIPSNDAILIAPLQVGNIYMILLTFFAANFFTNTHMRIARTRLNKLHYLVYRWMTSVLSFAVLSIFFGLISLAFQVDFTVTYGRSGFLVYFCITWLTMIGVGLANEIAIMIIVGIIQIPALLSCWMISWIILNISPSFSSMALTNNFYRYGYAMPTYNAFESTKTVFFDVYKGALGRHFGILVAWIVVLTVIFPFVLIKFGRNMAKKGQREAAEAISKAKAQLENEKSGA